MAPQVVTMVETGFTQETSKLALLMNHGNVDLALAALLEANSPPSSIAPLGVDDSVDAGNACASFVDTPVVDTPPTTTKVVSIGAPL